MAEKTFDPTPRHIEQARKKGQVAQSRELAGAITLLVAVYFLGSRLGIILGGLEEVMKHAFKTMGTVDITLATVQEGAIAYTWQMAGKFMPLPLLIAGTGITVTVAQTRGLFSTHLLKPDFKRLNPMSGLKRMFSTQSLFETGKGILKMSILIGILYSTLQDVPGDLARLSQNGLGPGIAYVGEVLGKMAQQSAMLLVATAILDYIWQYRKHRKDMKMSREDVMEELKNAEGQPFIKAKIREMQRSRSRQRMMQELAYADVVVTNPTHLAIALRYDSEAMSAPKVVAKGKGFVAEQIVDRARELHIPITQNIPLAHALINVELDAHIPLTLYQAVAEVLAFVYKLRRKGTTS
jgi:flagellar biosynthetic protein FlhB